MEPNVKAALDRGGVIDITTIGAKTGAERRIEINFINLDGSYYITGRPGRKRDWLANVKMNPDFTVHIKHGASADLKASAREITDEDERNEVMYRILVEGWGNEPAKADHILSRWVEGSPLIEFTLT